MPGLRGIPEVITTTPLSFCGFIVVGDAVDAGVHVEQVCSLHHVHGFTF